MFKIKRYLYVYILHIHSSELYIHRNLWIILYFSGADMCSYNSGCHAVRCIIAIITIIRATITLRCLVYPLQVLAVIDWWSSSGKYRRSFPDIPASGPIVAPPWRAVQGPFCYHDFTLIPAWISNCIDYKVWNEIAFFIPKLMDN